MSEEEPLRESLSLVEYVKICKDLLLDCFDVEGNVNKRANSNLKYALEILEEMEEAEWIDTSQTDQKEYEEIG